MMLSIYTDESIRLESDTVYTSSLPKETVEPLSYCIFNKSFPSVFSIYVSSAIISPTKFPYPPKESVRTPFRTVSERTSPSISMS